MKVDYSTLASFLACQRRAQYEYVEAWRPRGTKAALDFGTTLHAGLETWHTQSRYVGTSAMLDRTLEVLSDPTEPPLEPAWGFNEPPHMCVNLAALNSIKITATKLGLPTEPAEDGKIQRYSLQHALKLMYEYIRIYERPEDSFRVLRRDGAPQVEVPLSHLLYEKMDSTRNITYGGTMDMLALDGDEIVIVENKTTGKIWGYADTAALSLQASGYVWLARKALGLPVSRVIYNLLKTAYGKTDRTLDHTPSKNFQRIEVTREEWQLEEFERSVTRAALNLRSAIAENDFIMNAPNACNDWGGCAYKDVCLTPPSDRATLLQNNFEHSPWKGFEK